jgi:uncharacterized membrane protein YczE
MKKTFYTEAAYFVGLFVLAIGTALMERGDFGMYMVVAPAYILHRRLVEFLPFFSFGMAEYTLQLVLLIAIAAVMRRVKIGYLLSFVTAVIYGFMLDFCLWAASFLPSDIPARIVFFVLGMVICSVGVALLFRTYFPPEAYELFVKEIAAKSGAPISRVKTVYDCISCGVGVALSFAFFGFGVFVGVKWGTVVCALSNGWMIGRIAAWMEKRFDFRDRYGWKKYLG